MEWEIWGLWEGCSELGLCVFLLLLYVGIYISIRRIFIKHICIPTINISLKKEKSHMKIRIVAIGKLKEKYLKDAINEYSKRLSRFVQLDIVELPDEKTPEKISFKEQQIVLKKEADKMSPKIPSNSTLILMDVQGKAMTSEDFAKTLENYTISGKSSFCIIIGGSLGIHDSLKQRADLLLSMSNMTFPHQLARVILLEQLYRAFKIMNNETYHK